MQFTREAYINLMTFGAVDRPMFVELFGPLIGLEEEWLAQGASQEEIDMVAFDWDYVPVVQCGGNTSLHGGDERIVLEETDRYIIERDELGRTMKMFRGVSTLPLPLDFPVTDMVSWLRIKPLYTFQADRIDWAAVAQAKIAQMKGSLVVGQIPGAFDMPRQLMGAEQACMAYYDQPDLMRDILNTFTETACQVFERITETLVIDQLSVHEDLAGKAGPLVGPRQVPSVLPALLSPGFGNCSPRAEPGSSTWIPMAILRRFWMIYSIVASTPSIPWRPRRAWILWLCASNMATVWPCAAVSTNLC